MGGEAQTNGYQGKLCVWKNPKGRYTCRYVLIAVENVEIDGEEQSGWGLILN